MKNRSCQKKKFNLFPSRAGRVMFVWCELVLVREISNSHQPNIPSGHVTRSNSTDEFSLT